MADFDPDLGRRVNKHLVNLRLETPMDYWHGWPDDKRPRSAKRKEYIAGRMHEILRCLDFDLQDDSLADTPMRVAKMFVDELFLGMDYDYFPKCTTVKNKMRYDEMLCVKNISVMSVCEHHIQNITGKAFIAYVPGKNVLGLSKFSRVVKFFSKRPQVQERLTQQIGETIKFICETDNVAVFISASHGCMTCRGVEDVNAITDSAFLSGGFKDDPALRQEFYDSIKL